MKLETHFLKKIISSDKPTELIFQQLLKFGVRLAGEDLKTFYYDLEPEIKGLEEFLFQTYGEYYKTYLAKECFNNSIDFDFSGDTAYLVMDGLSFREGILLYRSIKEEYHTTIDYSFSGIPSTTERFREKIGFDELKKKANYGEISNLQNIDIDAGLQLVWSRFPDFLLDKIRLGKTVVSDLTEMYRSVEKILRKIIRQTDAETVVVTSDHGYIRAEAGFTFDLPKRAVSLMRTAFGGNRFRETDNLTDRLLRTGFVENYDAYDMIKSHYVYPVRGKYNLYLHGGLSLMECLVPVIRLTIAD